MTKVKCYVINNDISIFEYYLFDKYKTFQVELLSKTNKRYIIASFDTIKKAKEYVKLICG